MLISWVLEVKVHRHSETLGSNTVQSKYRERRLSFESKQTIYNTWIENCITSTDEWNGRNVVQISKRKYLENVVNFHMNQLDLKNTEISMVKCIILQITWFWHAPRKSFWKRVSCLTWKSTSLWPFLITYPTEKKISWCLCKMCLNARLLFEQFKVDIYFTNFGQVKIQLNRSFLLTLDRSQLFYWVWVRHDKKNDSNPLRLIKIQEPCA